MNDFHQRFHMAEEKQIKGIHMKDRSEIVKDLINKC